LFKTMRIIPLTRSAYFFYVVHSIFLIFSLLVGK
jgi:hypothetical protein